jgi:phosphopantothenoylcysteine decarboxylase / phosphopantothenate---cysteine ligase
MRKGTEIVLGVTGGIAAYKAAEFVRLLVKREARVHVVMTRNACRFVTPLTFQTLSCNPVVTDLFSLYGESEIGHVALADRARIVVVLPATANLLGKVASGIADDALSTLVMATKAPVLFAPAMNVNMWESAAVKENFRTLLGRGFFFVEPGTGELACGWMGQGRLADLDDVLERVEEVLSPKDLAGERILVTAGPTQEPIDPVRFISNRSSGRMGFALARMARRRGAEVILVAGPASQPLPGGGIESVHVRTAAEMREAVLGRMERCSVIIKAAAVADYRPREVRPAKIKKAAADFSLALEKTDDILAEAGRRKGNRLLVGFAAETEDLVANARKKLEAKNLDLVVANDVTLPGAGFDQATNRVKLLFPSGQTKDLPLMSKEEVADSILDEVARLLKERKSGPGPG